MLSGEDTVSVLLISFIWNFLMSRPYFLPSPLSSASSTTSCAVTERAGWWYLITGESVMMCVTTSRLSAASHTVVWVGESHHVSDYLVLKKYEKKKHEPSWGVETSSHTSLHRVIGLLVSIFVVINREVCSRRRCVRKLMLGAVCCELFSALKLILERSDVVKWLSAWAWWWWRWCLWWWWYDDIRESQIA